MKNYDVLNELVPKTQELHRAIFDKGYEQGKAYILDKVRAEVEQLTYYWCEVNPKSVIDDVLKIIDKYREVSV